MAENRQTWMGFFASELRQWRDVRGMSQEQLANGINYSPSTVAAVETTFRRPKPDFVERCDKRLETGGAEAPL